MNPAALVGLYWILAPTCIVAALSVFLFLTRRRKATTTPPPDDWHPGTSAEPALFNVVLPDAESEFTLSCPHCAFTGLLDDMTVVGDTVDCPLCEQPFEVLEPWDPAVPANTPRGTTD